MPVNMKNIIADTFMKMVRKKGIDKITVKVLIDECGISRQTFYYHFRDIMDVVEWLVKKFVDQMVERSLEIGTPENAVKVLITSTVENRNLVRKMMNSHKREEIERLFAQGVRTYLQKLIQTRREKSPVNCSDMEIVLDFIAYGLCGVLFKCCESGHFDVEKITEQICYILPGRIETL